MKGNRRSSGTDEVKMKRSAESTELQPKKAKNDSPVDSSTKVRPKVKKVSIQLLSTALNNKNQLVS